MGLTWEQTKEAMRIVNDCWNLLDEIEKGRWRAEAWMRNYESFHKYYYHMLISKLLDECMEYDQLQKVGIIKNMKYKQTGYFWEEIYFLLAFELIRSDGTILDPKEFGATPFTLEAYNKNMEPHPCVTNAAYGSYDLENCYSWPMWLVPDIDISKTKWIVCCNVSIDTYNCGYGEYYIYLKLRYYTTIQEYMEKLFWAEAPVLYCKLFIGANAKEIPPPP